jgi:hypothetical protein
MNSETGWNVYFMEHHYSVMAEPVVELMVKITRHARTGFLYIEGLHFARSYHHTLSHCRLNIIVFDMPSRCTNNHVGAESVGIRTSGSEKL